MQMILIVYLDTEYNAEENLLDVEIAQALNMQLRMAPNNRDTEMLLIDVVE